MGPVSGLHEPATIDEQRGNTEGKQGHGRRLRHGMEGDVVDEGNGWDEECQPGSVYVKRSVVGTNLPGLAGRNTAVAPKTHAFTHFTVATGCVD